jgi:hypothetical protein
MLQSGQPVLRQQDGFLLPAQTVVAVNGVSARESAIAARDETYAIILNAALVFDIFFPPFAFNLLKIPRMPFPDQARAEEREHSPRCTDDLAFAQKRTRRRPQ